VIRCFDQSNVTCSSILRSSGNNGRVLMRSEFFKLTGQSICARQKSGWLMSLSKDSTLCGREPGGDASDNNGGSLSVDEQIASGLGPSPAAGLPAEESRNNGRPDSSRQPGQIRRFHPATVSVRGSPTAKHFDQAVRNVTQSKRTATTPSLPRPKMLEKQPPL
jgi:hypothetical protein